MSNIVFMLLGVGSLGLLAATLGKKGGTAGEVVASGTNIAGDGNEYQWRVEVAPAGADGSHLGRAAPMGFSLESEESIVAMGTSADGAKALTLEYLAELA
jgi:hypothetical protein